MEQTQKEEEETENLMNFLKFNSGETRKDSDDVQPMEVDDQHEDSLVIVGKPRRIPKKRGEGSLDLISDLAHFQMND